jgi:transposase
MATDCIPQVTFEFYDNLKPVVVRFDHAQAEVSSKKWTPSTYNRRCEMEQIPRQQYTKEFREQAVRLVLEQQVTIPEAARRLTMSGRTLERWVCRARQGQFTTLGESRRPVTDLEAELSRLTRDLAEVRMERHILKKPPRTLRVKTEVGCP